MTTQQLMRALRGEQTFRSMSERTGLSKSTLFQLQHGSEPSLATLNRLVRAYPEQRNLFIIFLSENVLDNESPVVELAA